MEILNYQKLCKICDQILHESAPSNIDVVAIPFLHILRSHPVLDQPYEFLFQKKSIFDYLCGRIFQFLKNLLYLARQIFFAISSDGKMWYSVIEADRTTDVLIFSHYLKNFMPKNREDFYYGDLVENLKINNLNARVVQLNTTYDNMGSIYKYLRKFKSENIIFSRSLGLLDEIRINIRLKRAAKSLHNKRKSTSDDLIRAILSEAILQSKSPGAKLALRLNKQITSLMKAIKPKIFMLTYEGHAWERLIMNAVLSVNPETVIIAYQHGAIFRGQHAIYRDIEGVCNPGYIFASGEYGFNCLKNYFPSSRILLYGSQRANKKILPQDDNNLTVLVVPEGLIDECRRLFKFSLECALLYPEVKFIWRLHPLITFEDLKKKYDYISLLPDNIELSNVDFMSDVKRSRYILHRGSTAVIEAVANGLIPIYLCGQSEPFEITPLHIDFEKIFKVLNPSDLSMDVLKTLKKTHDSGSLSVKCRNYFSEIDLNLILNLA